MTNHRDTPPNEPIALPFSKTPEETARDRILACLQQRLPTLWHLLAQHSLPFIVVYLAPRVCFRTATMNETNTMYATALERHIVVHDYTERDGRLVEGRQLWVAHPLAGEV